MHQNSCFSLGTNKTSIFVLFMILRSFFFLLPLLFFFLTIFLGSFSEKVGETNNYQWLNNNKWIIVSVCVCVCSGTWHSLPKIDDSEKQMKERKNYNKTNDDAFVWHTPTRYRQRHQWSVFRWFTFCHLCTNTHTHTHSHFSTHSIR